MNRREFIAAASLVAWPLAGSAQQTGKVYRIGFLSYLGCGASLEPNGAFRQGLREVGYIEGGNLVLECRDALGRVDRFPALATELVRLKVDVLVAESTPASVAAMQATKTIPIVILSVGDPVASGLVTNLARPGGNITGLSLWPAIEVVTKVLELLKEVVPSMSRLAILRDPTNSAQVLTDGPVNEAGRKLGMRTQHIDVRAAAGLRDAFAEAINQRAQALFVYPLPVALAEIRRIADFALENRLLAVTLWEGYAEQGFFMFYGTRFTDHYRRAGAFIAKILKGAAPGDLPIEQPTKFELVINLKTAKALGVDVPPAILARADKVIE